MSAFGWFVEGACFMAGVVILTLIAQQLYYTWKWYRPAPRPRVIHTRWGWCQACGDKVYDGDLHEVGKIHDDGLDEHGGGSFSRAEFCPKHCPGTCVRPHEPAEV